MEYALLGHPLGHSLSPELHRLLSVYTGEALVYTLRDTLPEQVPARMEELLRLRGFNVTIPYKQAVIPCLDRLDDSAQLYGSVNTVLNVNGEHIGFNTDCIGFSRSLEELTEGRPPRSALVLGAGGVGRTFVLELARTGAAVTVAARASSLSKAQALCAEAARAFGAQARAVEVKERDIEGEEPFDLLVNATPAGMFPHVEETPACARLIERCARVYDCIYNPVETRLLTMARGMGKPVLGGMRMLVWQGAGAQEIWSGARFTSAQISQTDRALCALL